MAFAIHDGILHTKGTETTALARDSGVHLLFRVELLGVVDGRETSDFSNRWTP